MGLFQKFKAGLAKTHHQLVHELKRIVSGSPKLTGQTLEELEAALLGADLGMGMTTQIEAGVGSPSRATRWKPVGRPTKPRCTAWPAG